MARNREGDLRLLKDGVVFGPTDRAGLDKLLALGRITPTDQVSVRNADWISIAHYLAAPAAVAEEKPVAPLQAEASPKKRGDLRVISGGRIIGSLSRVNVEQLRTTGRLNDDELICAVGGPWMRIGDFLSPPAAPAALAVVEAVPLETLPLAEVVSPVIAIEDPIEAEVIEPEPAPPVTRPRTSSAPPRSSPPPVRHVPAPQQIAQPAAAYLLSGIRPPAPPANDEWFVRVRGIYSAPLRRHHVKALYQAQEITLDSVARHTTWHDNDWRPIRSIPTLADIAQP
jgi:hypothetical protein